MTALRHIWRIFVKALRLLRQPVPALPQERAHPYRDAAPAPPPEPVEVVYAIDWYSHTSGPKMYAVAELDPPKIRTLRPSPPPVPCDE